MQTEGKATAFLQEAPQASDPGSPMRAGGTSPGSTGTWAATGTWRGRGQRWKRYRGTRRGRGQWWKRYRGTRTSSRPGCTATTSSRVLPMTSPSSSHS